MRALLTSALLASALLSSGLVQADDKADVEVQYLLEFVAASGCTFERNGSEHSAPDAADHLRLKYKRGGRYVNSAEQFIDRLASESSWTGNLYTVTCGETTQPSGEWLHQALSDYRELETK